jgi:regulator of protease activity HflC (stomatin/prohibitin superfamily)
VIAVAIVVAIVVVYFFLKAKVIVPNDSAYVVERMGQYVQTLHPGFHVLMPLLDRVAFKHPLAMQTEEFSDAYETKDRRSATLKSSVRFRVLDAKRASYGAADYLDYLRTAVRTYQKKYVEGQNWESLREDTRSAESEILRNVDGLAEAVGVKVLEYEVKDLQPA